MAKIKKEYTSSEQKIMDILEGNLGEVVLYKDLIENYYEPEMKSQIRVLNVKMTMLRKKIPSYFTIIVKSRQGYLMFDNRNK